MFNTLHRINISMTDAICLSCVRAVRLRRKSTKGAVCTKCHRKVIISMGEFTKMVVEGKAFLKEVDFDQLTLPLMREKAPSMMKTTIKTLGKLPFDIGLKNILEVLDIANSWEPDKLPAEDHVFLRFMRTR
jgi:hypothetical protein